MRKTRGDGGWIEIILINCWFSEMQLTINTVGKGGIIDLSRLVIIPHGSLRKARVCCCCFARRVLVSHVGWVGGWCSKCWRFMYRAGKLLQRGKVLASAYFLLDVCVFKGCVHFCSSSCCSNQVLRNECVQIADRVPLWVSHQLALAVRLRMERHRFWVLIWTSMSNQISIIERLIVLT